LHLHFALARAQDISPGRIVMDPMDQATTYSEQFVYETCRRSFLSLWACVNPRGRTAGKELCDVLVVFDPHVIVISVKEIALRTSGDESTNRNK
jgi:hypothetical protein